jgi:hypothetical protein
MASITYDGQSFMLDGRRIWLVSGTIQYTRCPRAQWSERIHAAKLAGLNTIATDVVWARHEPRTGQFDFTGDNDLRHFVELIRDAGLYCLLRMGPYVGGGIDLGGVPPWLMGLNEASMRTSEGPFLESASRFISAVAKQVRELQATAPAVEEIEDEDEGKPVQKKPGPIILIQNESEWTCGDDDLALSYLGELNRYLRESGFEVPIINANNLWQGVEGEIDGWTGTGDMIGNLRQLARVRPTNPRVVTEYRVDNQEYWGGAPAKAMDSATLQRGLAEILAAAGQYNVEPFFAGTNMGFMGGRLSGGPDRYAVTSAASHAPLEESGKHGATFGGLRRVSMFASRFGRLLSHLDPRQQAATLHPGSVHQRAGAKRGMVVSDGLAGAPVVVHASGTQGSVAFVFAGERDKSEPLTATPMLLSDGTVLPVYLGDNPVVWCVLEHRLAGRSTLDYCNLSAFALVGSVFVCSGPAGTPARMSINGAPLEIDVPKEDPEIILHEGITVVICPDGSLDRIQVTDDGVFIGAIGLDHKLDPIVAKGSSGCSRITPNGDLQELKIGANSVRQLKAIVVPPPPKGRQKPAPKPKKTDKKEAPPAPVYETIHLPTVHVEPAHKAPSAPALSHWSCATCEDYLTGESARYASIAGPADLTKLGAPFGYGWYRITLKNTWAGKTDIAWPMSGDRLAMFLDAKEAGIVGVGPGADAEGSLNLKKGEQTLVVLAENLGRLSGGFTPTEKRGIIEHGYAVKPLRTGKPTLERGQPIDMLEHVTPQGNTAPGDMTDPARLTWTIAGKRKSPVLVRMAGVDVRGLIIVNDTVVGAFDATGPREVFIGHDKLGRGTNTVQLAILGDAHGAEKALAENVTLWDCEAPFTEEASWAFAKWEQPAASAFDPKAKPSKGPAWFKATFNAHPAHAPHASLWFDTHGLTKGQAYVNGKHIGRYFTATSKGHDVGPQTMLHIPAPLIKDGANEIVIFDEHGHSPSKSKLVYRE